MCLLKVYRQIRAFYPVFPRICQTAYSLHERVMKTLNLKDSRIKKLKCPSQNGFVSPAVHCLGAVTGLEMDSPRDSICPVAVLW